MYMYEWCQNVGNIFRPQSERAIGSEEARQEQSNDRQPQAASKKAEQAEAHFLIK